MQVLDTMADALRQSGIPLFADLRPAKLKMARMRSLADWKRRHAPRSWEATTSAERRLVPDTGDEFNLRGYCWPDRQWLDFKVDFQCGGIPEGNRWPNWRERLACPACGFNNRQRGAIHAFEQSLRPSPDARVYLTEQASLVYAWMKKRYPATIGSEFLDPEMAGGALDERGIRHEDVTRLSFEDESLDFILSFDVFEHVPMYRKAFSECARVLRSGGAMLFSVPFVADSAEVIVRASPMPDGSIVHHHPAEFHGDPVHPGEGVLCYQHFGWSMLDDLREAGFRDAIALGFHSFRYGYLGGETLLFVATK